MSLMIGRPGSSNSEVIAAVTHSMLVAMRRREEREGEFGILSEEEQAINVQF